MIDHPASAGGPRVPRLFGAAPSAGRADVVEAVRAAGGRTVPQLWHVDTDRTTDSLPNPGGPRLVQQRDQPGDVVRPTDRPVELIPYRARGGPNVVLPRTRGPGDRSACPNSGSSEARRH
ncbi:hypothetical protein ACWDV4_28860 [Micromonospora sp. NPDC003197]